MGLDDSMNQFVSLFAEAKQGFVAAVPNLVTAVAVLLLGWAVAWALRGAVRRVLRRIGARISPGPTREAWTEAVEGQKTGLVAANGVYWFVLLVAMVVAVDALDVPVLRRWMSALASYLPRFAIAAALILGGVVAGRLARNAIVGTAFRMPASQSRNLARLTQVSIVVAAGLIAAGQLGLDVSLLSSVFLIMLAAILGAAALAFGLGAREVMADILAMHYVNKSYRIGQVVRIGSDQGRIVRTSRTAVYLENALGELSIPGRHFSDSRCVLLNQEEDRGA